MSDEKLGNAAMAAKGYAEFLAAWKHADAGLGEVIHAQNFIAEHPLPAVHASAQFWTFKPAQWMTQLREGRVEASQI